MAALVLASCMGGWGVMKGLLRAHQEGVRPWEALSEALEQDRLCQRGAGQLWFHTPESAVASDTRVATATRAIASGRGSAAR